MIKCSMTHIRIFILQVKMIDFWIRLIEFFHQLYITVIILNAGSWTWKRKNADDNKHLFPVLERSSLSSTCIYILHTLSTLVHINTNELFMLGNLVQTLLLLSMGRCWLVGMRMPLRIDQTRAELIDSFICNTDSIGKIKVCWTLRKSIKVKRSED